MKDLEKVLNAGCGVLDNLDDLDLDDIITVLAGVIATLANDIGVSSPPLAYIVAKRAMEMEQ